MASRETMRLQERITHLEAALKDMCLVHFPYVDPKDDPKALRQEFHKRVIGTLIKGEPYIALV
jgi:hypothetical protein